MSDSERSWSQSDSADLDFAGLLPGDEQPRRRRRSRGPAAGTRETRETEQPPADQKQAPSSNAGAAPDEEEARAPAQEPPRQDPPATPSESATTSRFGEEISGPGVGETSPETGAGEAAATGGSDPGTAADQAPRSARPEPSSASDAVMRTGAPDRRDTSYADAPPPRESPEPGGPAGGAELTERGPVSSVAGVGRLREQGQTSKLARLSQAVLVEGEDLDRILRGIADVRPEDRAGYKTTIRLSDDHYELLADLRKEFRRSRGFAGHEATISNVMALGLELVREALDAEKNLPGQ